MAKEDRALLETIAADIVYLSMEYIGTDYSEILAEAAAMTDTELIDFITR